MKPSKLSYIERDEGLDTLIDDFQQFENDELTSTTPLTGSFSLTDFRVQFSS